MCQTSQQMEGPVRSSAAEARAVCLEGKSQRLSGTISMISYNAFDAETACRSMLACLSRAQGLQSWVYVHPAYSVLLIEFSVNILICVSSGRRREIAA